MTTPAPPPPFARSAISADSAPNHAGSLASQAPTPAALSAGLLPSLALPHNGPLSFESSAPDGRWLVVCQAREDTNRDSKVEVKVQPNGELTGDALRRYFTLASGEDFAIEDFWVASPDGAHVILKRAGKVELWDLERATHAELDVLSADVRREPGVRDSHRTLAFSADALFYVRRTQQGSALIEHPLREGDERILWQGPDSVVRFTIEGAGRYAVLWVPGRDANGNGRFDWPFKPTLEPKPCRGSLPRFLSSEASADGLAAVVVDRFRLESRRFDDLALVLADGVVRRDVEGALFLQRDAERATLLADKDCGARILWAHRTDQTLLFGCNLPKRATRLGVEAYSAGRRQPLDIDVAGLGFDEPAQAAARLVPLYPGADTVLFDLEKRALHRLSPGDAVVGSSGPHALIRRGRTLLIFDAEVSREAALPGTLEQFGSVLSAPPLLFISPLLVDVAEGRVLGQLPGRALALTRSGQLLVPQVPATDERLAEGPLAWKSVE